jgi:hypothetical protein
VRISRIGEREDCTYAGFQLAAANEFGDRAQPLGRYFHQEEGCGDLASQNTGRGGSGSAEAKAQQKEILRLLTEHGAT